MHVLRRTLQTRGYELDRSGQVGPLSWLRYFEHLRWEAGADEALGLSRLFEDGNRMVVRVQKLELCAPVGHGETLELETWVSRVGKTSLDLVHLARRAADGCELARGAVTIVHVGADGAPRPVPDALRALVRELGAQPQISALAGRRPGHAYSEPLQVRASDIDLLQHVNHAVYAAYFDDARVRALAAGAYEPRRRASFPLRALAIDYVREVKLGDALRVFTWNLDHEPAAFGFDLLREGEAEPVARGRFEVSER